MVDVHQQRATFCDLPVELRDSIRSIYMNDLITNISNMHTLNDMIPTKKNVDKLMHALRTAYESACVSKTTIASMGVACSNGDDVVSDFKENMDQLLEDSGGPLAFLYKLRNGFDDLVVTYGTLDGRETTVRLRMVEPNDAERDMERRVELIQSADTKTVLKETMFYYDHQFDMPTFDAYRSINTLHLVQKMYTLLYHAVPSFLVDDFYIKQIQRGVVPPEGQNAWEDWLVEDRLPCEALTEHTHLVDDNDALYVESVYVYQS